MKYTSAAVASSLLLASFAAAWGAAGHEIVATIAQIHLHSSTWDALLPILPPSNPHLAAIATWPDRIRWIPEWRFASELHYTSPTEDHPPQACFFGEKGFQTNHDVLHAIGNYSTRLSQDSNDWSALRFLVHFIGDVHQPLHLTDRSRGGNGDPILFEGRHTNLHSLWDNFLIAKALREQHNYTTPLASKQIESNLRGAIYDPFIRLILWEGVRSWWRSQLPTWLACAEPEEHKSQQAVFASPHKLKGTICPEQWEIGRAHV